MLRLKPIRKPRRRGLRRDVRLVGDAAFCSVLALAVGLAIGEIAHDLPQSPGPDKRSLLAGAAPTPHILRPLPQPDDDAGLRPAFAHEEPAPTEMPAIAIVIDDLGADIAHTRQAIALPKAVALAFLPYPDSTPMLARDAGRAGHEILVHEPMQAIGAQDPGPMALSPALTAGENVRRLTWALARVPGFVGINNHEGSLFSADRKALTPVVEALAGRGVFFFDSRTAANSQIVATARAFGVASAGRDVFLDDVVTLDGIDAELRALESRARNSGVAIAIGHPHAITLDAVAYWAAHDSGFRLVTLREAIRLKTRREMQRSLALVGG
jgi:polysaccharide deacetylase 2 family uncharacterized protein YibQ